VSLQEEMDAIEEEEEKSSMSLHTDDENDAETDEEDAYQKSTNANEPVVMDFDQMTEEIYEMEEEEEDENEFEDEKLYNDHKDRKLGFKNEAFPGLRHLQSINPRELGHVSHELADAEENPDSLPNEYLIEEYKAIFKMLDPNGDGNITVQEFTAGMAAMNIFVSKDEILDIMGSVDEDDDQEVDFDEFVHLMHANFGVTITEEDVKNAFDEADRDHDGHLDAEDLLEFMKKLGEEITIEEATLMIEAVDTNASGEIEFPEFKHVLMSSSFM